VKDDLRKQIGRLAEQRKRERPADWVEDEPSQRIIVEAGGVVHVENKMTDEKSGLIQSVGGVIVSVVKAVQNPYGLGALLLLVGGFVAWLVLK
jgi:hypothetical protein